MSLVPPSHREGLRNKADSYEKLAQRVIIRQDTPDGWLKNDPVLESGEFGYEIGYPNGKIKIGTGSTRWSELPYLMARGPSGQPGAPGPAGPPGKGIQIKGVADVWPPPGTPEVGDLWILDDPIPPTAPAGSSPGDGYSWTGTKWVATGPIQGPPGKDGVDGAVGQSAKPVAVYTTPVTPAAPNPGDMWLKPGANPGETNLNIWDATQWVEVASGGGGTVDLTGYIKQGDDANLNNLNITGDVLAPYGFFYTNNLTVGGDFFYGGGSLKAGEDPRNAPQGYQLPVPTEQGYLRADQDPATGWYFAEPVVVSDTTPPTPPGSPALPTLWIDPNGDPPVTEFTNVSPPVYRDSMITEQANGLPIGLDQAGMFFYQPDIVGGVPVLVNGKRYLLPIIEAPANKMTQTLPEPMFVFKDPMTTQQSDGTYIGLDPTGQFVTQPHMIGAIPVLVNGVRFMLPLIEE